MFYTFRPLHLLCITFTILATTAVKASTPSPEKPSQQTQKVYVAAKICEAARKRAVELASTAHTYQGTPITAESINALGKPMDPESAQAVNKWLARNLHIVSALVNVPVHGDLPERQKRFNEISALIKAAELQNLSAHNFVFAIEVPVNGEQQKFVIKIAGPANRRENYNALLGKPYNSLMTAEEYEKLKQDGAADTYQTISRKAHALRLQEWVEQHPAAGIIAPETHLVQVPDAGSAVVDKNYVVVEKFIEHTGTPDNDPKAFLDKLPEIADAIAYTGMWNIFSRQFLVLADGKIACIDLEDPNNSKAPDFFHKNQKKYVGNVSCGLEELEALEQELDQVQKKRAALVATLIVTRDTITDYPSDWGNYKS